MLRNLCQLEYKNENEECRLLCGNTASTTFLKEALFQFQKYIGAVEDAVKAQQAAQSTPIAPDAIDPPAEPLSEETPVAQEGNEHA